MEYLIGDFTMQRCTFYQKLIGNITEMFSVKKCQKMRRKFGEKLLPYVTEF
jgi:hypothetical protein